MIEIITAALIVIGGLFLTVGTLGLIRLPDVYNRMHATTKATTMGTASIFLAATTSFGFGPGMTSLIAVLFLFLTAPTGAHLISRAAHRNQVEFAGEAEWPEVDTKDEEVERKKQRSRDHILKEYT
jgi:multicomponent Na+:H+ antiporter subunit G